MSDFAVLSQNAANPLLHPVYLPFTASQLARHFVRVRNGGSVQEHINYYVSSINRYATFLNHFPTRSGVQLSTSKVPCQIEKDERFWTAACWMALFYHKDRRPLEQLLGNAFPQFPPLKGLHSWDECFEGELHLFFEPFLPSPPAYKLWLAKNMTTRHLIPHILDAASRANQNFEGPTRGDVLLINATNGFSILTEAKVSADISHEITFDLLRNQLARNVDVTLESNESLPPPLRQRIPDRTLFLLQSPELIRANPESRFYGWLMRSFQNDPEALRRHLPHRTDVDWGSVVKRLGWITWEDCNTVLPTACKWLT